MMLRLDLSLKAFGLLLGSIDEIGVICGCILK